MKSKRVIFFERINVARLNYEYVAVRLNCVLLVVCVCADIIAVFRARAKSQKPVSFHHLPGRPPGHKRWQILCP